MTPAGVTTRSAHQQVVDARRSRLELLAAGARGDPAAERRDLEGLREVAERVARAAAARPRATGPSMPAWKVAVRLSAIDAAPARSRRVVSSESAPAWPRSVRGSTPPTTLAAAAERDHREVRVGGDAQHRGDGAFARPDTPRPRARVDLAAAQAQQIGKAAADGVRHALERAGAHAVLAARGAQPRQHSGVSFGGGSRIASSSTGSAPRASGRPRRRPSSASSRGSRACASCRVDSPSRPQPFQRS